jgi:hypothetical protein
MNSQSASEYLKAINSLFGEFEQYQNMHPGEGGSGTSSLSRARIPSMFKRATGGGGGGGKGRRGTDASLGDATNAINTMPPPNTLPMPPGLGSGLGGIGSLGGAGASSTSLSTAAGSSAANSTLPLLSTVNTGSSHHHNTAVTPTTPHSAHPTSHLTASSSEPLLPTESYSHLLTPPLPFDPDFFETFATLCDVLIDCYAKITQLISAEKASAGGAGVAAAQGLAELFAKTDGKVKKVIFGAMMREFEERCREGLRGEVAGVGKVVLGGLIA